MVCGQKTQDSKATGDHIGAAEATTREIDASIRDLVGQGLERGKEILTLRRSEFDEGVRLLLTSETLTVKEFPPNRAIDGKQGILSHAKSNVNSPV